MLKKPSSVEISSYYFKHCFLFVLFVGILSAVENLDRETNMKYNFKVAVADIAGHTCMSDIFINVQDVNDNIPTFDQQLYIATVRENATQAVVITQVICLLMLICRNHGIMMYILIIFSYL